MDGSKQNSAKKLKRRKESEAPDDLSEDMGIAAMHEMGDSIYAYKTPGIQK